MPPIPYLGFHLPQEPRCDVVLHVDVNGVGVDDWLAGRVLHGEEGLDRLDLSIVAAVRHRLALGPEPKRGHPPGILTLCVASEVETNTIEGLQA